MYPAHAKSFAGSLLLAACMLFSGSVLAADATPDQVYQAAQAGNYRQAQEMMDQILRDHPNSAKAHFVQAELLAKQGKLPQAQAELNNALRLDPNQRFAKPGAVDELRTRISAASSGVSHAGGTFGGIPWGMVLGIAAVVIIASLVLQARRRAAYAAAGRGPYDYGGGMRGSTPYGGQPPMGPTQYGGQGSYGYPGGAGPGQAGGGLGSGIMGGLATGAAVGAGVVAGEALMNRVLHGGSSGTAVDTGGARDTASASNAADSSYDMGGKGFGLRDANSWDDDDPTRKLKGNDDDGNGQTWNIDYPWNNSSDSSGDSGGGDSWDSGGGSDDDWT